MSDQPEAVKSVWIMRVFRNVGRLRLVLATLVLIVVIYVLGQIGSSDNLDGQHAQGDHSAGNEGGLLSRNFKANYQYEDNDLVYYKKETPLIWVGGVPRSGTTLMRAMLDAHQDIRCGEETRVIPRLLSMHMGMIKSDKEMNRLKEAHITEGVLDHALGAYILSIISEHGEYAPHLCNKDPFTLKSMEKILTLFPNSKFLFMIRDGRATVHSIISRHVTIKGFDINSYRGALQDWNRAIESMSKECDRVGRDKCMPVFYEQLVLHPRGQMEQILDFLGIGWDEMVIHHEQSINKTGGVSLSGKELSTDQVERPINTEALTSWVPYIPSDVKEDMRKLAPMLEKLGYDPDIYPPYYGEPDNQVVNNDKSLKKANNFYQDRKPMMIKKAGPNEGGGPGEKPPAPMMKPDVQFFGKSQDRGMPPPNAQMPRKDFPPNMQDMARGQRPADKMYPWN